MAPKKRGRKRGVPVPNSPLIEQESIEATNECEDMASHCSTPLNVAEVEVTHTTKEISPKKTTRKYSRSGITRMQEVEIVEWFKEHEYLYNRAHKDSYNTKLKELVFKEQSEKMGISAEALKTALKTLRRNFTELTKKMEKSGSGVGNLSERENFIFESFKFLDVHVVRKKSISSGKFQKPCQVEQLEVSSDEDSEIESNESGCTDEAADSPPPIPSSSTTGRAMEMSDEEDNMPTVTRPSRQTRKTDDPRKIKKSRPQSTPPALQTLPVKKKPKSTRAVLEDIVTTWKNRTQDSTAKSTLRTSTFAAHMDEMLQEVPEADQIEIKWAVIDIFRAYRSHGLDAVRSGVLAMAQFRTSSVSQQQNLGLGASQQPGSIITSQTNIQQQTPFQQQTSFPQHTPFSQQLQFPQQTSFTQQTPYTPHSQFPQQVQFQQQTPAQQPTATQQHTATQQQTLAQQPTPLLAQSPFLPQSPYIPQLPFISQSPFTPQSPYQTLNHPHNMPQSQYNVIGNITTTTNTTITATPTTQSNITNPITHSNSQLKSADTQKTITEMQTNIMDISFHIEEGDADADSAKNSQP